MGNLNVAVMGSPGFSRDIGKQGTVSDVTLYNVKRGDDAVTLIEPTRYPERLAPLFYAASMSNMAIMVVERLDNQFGEALLMLDCAGVGRGMIVLRNYIALDQITPMIKGTVAEGYEFVDDDPVVLRERLLDLASEIESDPAEGKDVTGAVQVDHHFNVKGVGTVVLGLVSRGTIRRHDKLTVMPLNKVATVRSIQKHDDDWDWAVAGDRVGLALKNIDSDDLDRGFVLTNDPNMVQLKELTATADLVRFWPEPLKQDMVIHVGHWMQVVPARIVAMSGDDWRHPELTLALEKELIHPPGSRAVLLYLEGGKLRIVGSIPL